jgi:TolB-like protein
VFPLRDRFLVAGVALIGFLSSGCGASVSSYIKPEAPWGVIRRVAVLPFALLSENPVQRELATKLFAEELRKTGRAEVVEVPLDSPLGSGVWDVKQVGKQFQADAVITGSVVDDTLGLAMHMQVRDVATEELLWSGTYIHGTRYAFFSFKLQQQKVHRGFRWLARKFAAESAAAP